jgi:hypothetical protein
MEAEYLSEKSVIYQIARLHFLGNGCLRRVPFLNGEEITAGELNELSWR